MMYTDSISTTKKLDLDSKKLGEFSCDFTGSIYALQSGFYAKNGIFEKSRGIGQLGDETIIHKDTKVDSKRKAGLKRKAAKKAAPKRKVVKRL